MILRLLVVLFWSLEIIAADAQSPMQRALADMMKKDFLSIESVMRDLEQGSLTIEDLPDSFFIYHSKNEILYTEKFQTTYITPLMWLTAHANENFVQKLFDDDNARKKFLRSVKARSPEGVTALHLAVALAETTSSLAMVKLLLKAGANANAQKLSNQWTPLHMAIAYSKTIQMQELLVRELLCFDANVSLRTTMGNTPLLLAASLHRRGESLIALRALLEQPVNFAAANDNGNTVHDLLEDEDARKLISNTEEMRKNSAQVNEKTSLL